MMSSASAQSDELDAIVQEDELENQDELQLNCFERVVDRCFYSTKMETQCFAAFSAATLAMAAGTVLGWTSPIASALQNGTYHNITMTDSQLGWIGSLPTLGALLMCIPTGILCDLIGRKETILLSSVYMISGWMAIYFGENIKELYFGRLLQGFGVGAACVAVPMYVSEIASAKSRGALGTFFQLFIVIGVGMGYLSGAAVSISNHVLISCFVPLSLFYLTFLWQPKTPTFLLKQKDYQLAQKNLIYLRRTKHVQNELNEIDAMVKAMTNTTISFRQTFSRKVVIKAIVISLALMLFQQLSGINAIIFYATTFFEAADLDWSPQLASNIVALAQILTTTFSMLIVDRLGRKPLLLTSAFCMSAAILTLSAYYLFPNVLPNISPVIALVVFIVAFSLGFGPIPWMISGEIFTPEVRSYASALAGTFNWSLAFLVTRFYVEISKSIGVGYCCLFFGCVLIVALLFVWIFVPETKGKSINEIQTMLS